MGFESGVVSFRACYVPRGLPRDHVAGFAAQALPPVDSLGRDPIHGWVTGRHLLDSRITDETAHMAGRLRLTLAKAERKIPEALLQAECKMEELALLQAENRDSLDRKTRAEIKKQITERLWPAMPPTLSGIPIVYDGELLYAGATNDKQLDALTSGFEQAVDRRLIPLLPESAAMQRKQVNTRDLAPTSFSPELEDDRAGDAPGMDFLTWLWFFFEARGGILNVDGQQYAAMVEGPLTFFMEGAGAHLTALRNGQPLVSAEAKTALLSGKKLSRAKLVLARGDETWTATVDAASFLFRGFRFPKTEAFDPVSRFEERMLSLKRFMTGFLGLFDRFLDERADSNAWSSVRADMQRWVRGRKGKA